jgi:putative flavoprotein involved in K+ transport
MHLVQTSASADDVESIPTVIIGGGQAGLAIGYHLQRAGEQFVILDANARIGDTWRNRWDSLRLFSFPRYSSLPGWPMQLASFPTHNEMADYLEAYAQHFDLPVRSGVRVERLSRSDVPDRLSRSDVPDQLSPGNGGFRVETSHGELRANRVVVATGGYQTPVVPDFADEIAPGIQLHSCAYRNPSQLDGTVLVVGAGNSGAEICPGVDQVRPPDMAVWSASRPGSVPHRDPDGTSLGADRDVHLPPGAHARYAAGTEGPRIGDQARHPARSHQAE